MTKNDNNKEVDINEVPVPQEAKTYLMRWNPSINSFTEKDYENCVVNMDNDWTKGHSGELLSDDIAVELDKLCENKYDG